MPKSEVEKAMGNSVGSVNNPDLVNPIIAQNLLP